MGLTFNYIKSNYDSKLELNDINKEIDAIIATDRKDFGGFSYAQSLFLIENTYGLSDYQLDIFKISETISLKNTSVPPIVLIPIIKNDSIKTKELILEIVAICQVKNYRRILMTNFIRLSSSQIQSVLGLNRALEEVPNDFDLIIDFLVDENYIDEFTSSQMK
jgi:hypothetical protein